MLMLNLDSIRRQPGTILVLGAHAANIQAVLDFDYLCGKQEPSVVGIVTSSAKYQKYFWGKGEVLIHCYASVAQARQALDSVDWMFNMASGRRAYAATNEFFDEFPKARGGHIFAEDVPEIHAIDLYERYGNNKILIGPAGVGMIVPGALKLGVIGGIDWRQISGNRLMQPGKTAVLSASGGMVNEIITMVARSGHGISFSLCFGGDRFPTTRPSDAFLAAQADKATETIVYYGELGGEDEYELVELIKSKQVTKPVVCYIAGTIGESFDQPVQFGHAKALASNKSETASAKRNALREVGATVAESISEFTKHIANIPVEEGTSQQQPAVSLDSRARSLFSSTISHEGPEGYSFVGTSLQDWAREGSIALQITTGLLGRRPMSSILPEFVEKVFLLSVDHGPQVSGALNTVITARAGKGLVDSLAAGLMTIGPRFGGAVSTAAREWFDGVRLGRVATERVEESARAKRYIGGIGHKKYRIGMPDPRVAVLSEFADKLDKHPHYDYARSIEAVTTEKKGTLILNVDGVIAALMLDTLTYEEGYSADEIDNLIEMDFFNTLFVIPRTVGFISHYLDQRRLDEGLFRLPDDDVLLIGG